MIKKHKQDFNNNLLNTFNILSISGNYNIIGSSSLKSIYYNSDIDLNEHDSFNSYKKVYEKFKYIFQTCKENPNLFITDFKCGVNNKNEPLRWTYTDIMKGYIGKKSFEDCLKDKSMIKLDLVYLLNGIFVEISEVYFFKIQNHTNYNDDAFNTNTIKTSIQNEIHELLNDGKYFKVLKRMFSLLNIENSKNPIVNKLISFFNSQTGILYKANSDLNILLILIDNKFRKPNIDDIKNNLQVIKQNLSIQTQTHKNCSIIIDDICKQNNMNNMKIYIYKLCEYLQRVFNREAKMFFDIHQNKHKLIFSGGGQIFGSNNRVVPFQDAIPIGSNEGQNLTIVEDIYPITFDINDNEPQYARSAIINDDLPDDNLLPHSNEIRDGENSIPIRYVEANPSNSNTVINSINNKIKKIDRQIKNHELELNRLKEMQEIRRRRGRRTIESNREYITQVQNIQREIRNLERERLQWQEQLPIQIR